MGTGRATEEAPAAPVAGTVIPVSLLVSSARLIIERQLGLLWVSGEADLTHAQLLPRITDPSVDHYEITTLLGLTGCLDDFEAHMGIAR